MRVLLGIGLRLIIASGVLTPSLAALWISNRLSPSPDLQTANLEAIAMFVFFVAGIVGAVMVLRKPEQATIEP
jgi:hypothetical protein